MKFLEKRLKVSWDAEDVYEASRTIWTTALLLLVA